MIILRNIFNHILGIQNSVRTIILDILQLKKKIKEHISMHTSSEFSK